MNTKSIYILVGLPGIGKSTWLKDFGTKNPSFLVASSDDYLQQKSIEDGITYDEAYPVYIKEAEKEYKKKLQDMLDSGQNIIVDRTNLTAKSRAKILNKVPDGYTKTVIQFEITEDEHNNRLTNRVGKTLSPRIIQQMKDFYVEPSFEEKIDVIMVVDIN